MASTPPRKVVVFDADSVRADELCIRLRFLNYSPVLGTSFGTLDELVKENCMAVVLGSHDDAGTTTGMVASLREQCPDMPFIQLNDDTVTTALDSDWLLDVPLKRSQLQRLLDRAERHRGSDRRHRLTGESHPIRMVRALIEQVADYQTNVLITGQSGTGKELVARTIHDLSPRAENPFVPINCGAIPAELLESELFGHKKGAFTGAIADRIGRFELADGGTLFLDEIGDMTLDMQVKLLRVLQERTYERVGGNETIECDVRIVAATHRNLPEMVESGDFREDLYYRLNVYPIEMPPLYQRATDLPVLMNELFGRHGGKGGVRLSQKALQALARYQWPGNVRELGNLVERLAIIKPQGVIDVSDLPAKYLDPENQVEDVVEPNMVAQAMQLSSANLKDHLSSVEKELIEQAMTAADGVVAKAARLLNMRRTTLVEKLSKYDLSTS